MFSRNRQGTGNSPSLRAKVAVIAASTFAIVLVAVLIVRSNASLGALHEALTPPKLPVAPKYDKRVWLEQNWNREIASKYHNISQGTRTLPIPLSWFLALEQPKDSMFTIPFGRKEKFADDNYLRRFGFITGDVEGDRSADNPHGLPIGFSTVPFQNLPGLSNQDTGIGFNCAACHTGHFVYEGTEFIVDGAPATTDLGQLTEALGAALGQTLLSSKLPLLDGRFERFAENVLQDAYLDANKLILAQELEAVVNYLAALPDRVDVIEGFGRLDALNRIGNQVFAWDTGRFDNYAAINAPVNYPHIWTASWFNWVQYDGSIMQPLVRNAGEAIGVSAYLNTNVPLSEKRFSSSIPMQNLWWIENALGGDDPSAEKKFTGLHSPKWPAALPPIDQAKAAQGAGLYQQHCQGCHLPPLNSEEIWNKEYFAPITYFVDGQAVTTEESVLQLKLISLEQIGTDPAQSNVLKHRTVNTASVEEGPTAIGIDAEVCAWETSRPSSPYAEQSYEFTPTRLVNVPVSDGPTLNFGFALGGLVQQVTSAWFTQNYIPDFEWPYFEGGRPNCLQAGAGYKARPLNGVWATAPFLHNGSVPSLWDLLSPPEQRPTLVKLGPIEFDPVKVGLLQEEDMNSARRYDRDGYFILDTRLAGNSNRGHEFSSRWDDSKHYLQQERGVIGPELSVEERQALVEYLKTL